ncbi:MAG TPA: metallophosphoesterase [Candidatus Acidoferrales bacterium]|nr:metallophosphoesterase [Candidatus Acidoferrales bacterium]
MQPQPERRRIHSTIVSYSNVVQPFGGLDNFLTQTRKIAAKKIADAAQLDSTMIRFSQGMEAWRDAEVNPQILHTPQNAMASLLQSHIAKLASQKKNGLEQFFLDIERKILECFAVKFSPQDWPEWAASFFTWVPTILRPTRPPADPEPEAIGNSFAVGVLGDFGTGLYGAPVCAQSIVNNWNASPYQMLLHLGDIYYAATLDEVLDRMQQFWPLTPAINRALIGNHEMYDAGISYFGPVLQNFKQKTSYFAMQNDHWLLVGLDTAYNQDQEGLGGHVGVLDEDQIKWLRPIMASRGNRRVVLFTHHQPFSQAEDNNGGNLIRALSEFLKDHQIFAWYWGHEHRCLLYDKHPDHGFHGRCAGHAGFPDAPPDLSRAGDSDLGPKWKRYPGKKAKDGQDQDVNVPGASIYVAPNPYVPRFENDFTPNGFVRLEFVDDHLIEDVREPDNNSIYRRELA